MTWQGVFAGKGYSFQKTVFFCHQHMDCEDMYKCDKHSWWWSLDQLVMVTRPASDNDKRDESEDRPRPHAYPDLHQEIGPASYELEANFVTGPVMHLGGGEKDVSDVKGHPNLYSKRWLQSKAKESHQGVANQVSTKMTDREYTATSTESER